MVTAFRAAIFLEVVIQSWPLKLNAEDAATMTAGLNKLGVWRKGRIFRIHEYLLNEASGSLVVSEAITVLLKSRPLETRDVGGGLTSTHRRALPTPASLTTTGLPSWRFAGFRFIHPDSSTIHLLPVERRDSLSGALIVHLDEGKTARFTGVSIHDEIDRIDFAVLLKQFADLLLGSTRREISNVNALSHYDSMPAWRADVSIKVPPAVSVRE
jgi:hypothetical protein